ncbi:fatty acid desaturase family protein [Streptomyces xylophagus]|uniref:fatty acid desaturase family protein n=1 Tax=Streptomyces xylophagus TaxID=285514 RepID=UPI0005B7FB93|nr:acyl-CoA desaturase [Streptomyces xylophagus]
MDQPHSTSIPRHQTLYAELLRDIQRRGLHRRRHGAYIVRAAILLGFLGLLLTAHIRLGDSWWQLGLAAALGIVFTQCAFLGHDVAHRQVFASTAWSERVGRLVINGLVGASYGWWQSRHRPHHVNPNKVGTDPDVRDGILVNTGPGERVRRTALGRRTTRHQGSLFFALLPLTMLKLHVDAVAATARRASPPSHRSIEAPLLALRLAGFGILVFTMLPPLKALLFLAVELAVSGFYLGACFAPNHIGMPMPAVNASLDFLHRQVLMSRNVRGGRFMDLAMGGLNRQIEHHLFPAMPGPHLRLAAPVVRAFCERHAVPYAETGLFMAYGSVVRHLNHVGFRGTPRYVCHAAATLRPT